MGIMPELRDGARSPAIAIATKIEGNRPGRLWAVRMRADGVH